MAPNDVSGRDLGLMHRAARLYYVDELNQAAIAERLTVSRPTVSRLLAEARRVGIVQITVHDPDSLHTGDDDAPGSPPRSGWTGCGWPRSSRVTSAGRSPNRSVRRCGRPVCARATSCSCRPGAPCGS